jgi:hypothetical protein
MAHIVLGAGDTAVLPDIHERSRRAKEQVVSPSSDYADPYMNTLIYDKHANRSSRFRQ